MRRPALSETSSRTISFKSSATWRWRRPRRRFPRPFVTSRRRCSGRCVRSGTPTWCADRSGYRDEPGVSRTSLVPTYAALRLHLDSWRWDGVPFFVRAGKSLRVTTTEVIVELKNPPQVVFAEPAPSTGNYVRFRLSPDVVIAVGARAKQPGQGMTGRPVELSVVDERQHTGAGGSRVGDYERLLGDAIAADPTLFAREDVVEAAWAIVIRSFRPIARSIRTTLAVGDPQKPTGSSHRLEAGTRQSNQPRAPPDHQGTGHGCAFQIAPRTRRSSGRSKSDQSWRR